MNNQMIDGATGEDLEPLNLMSKQEFRDATRHLVNLSDENFETLWAEFQEQKRKRSLN